MWIVKSNTMGVSNAEIKDYFYILIETKTNYGFRDNRR